MTMMKKTWIALLSAAAVIAVVGGVAYAAMDDDGHANMRGHHAEMMERMAQMHGGGMHGGGMHGGGMQGGGPRHGASSASRKGDQSPATLAYRGANAKMHEAMEIEYSGNADIDFVKGMIPHHEGAVDMAKIVLAFGKDPEVKKLAEAIIKTQEDEIGWMKGWLEKNKR
jgi:hypothetical protein